MFKVSLAVLDLKLKLNFYRTNQGLFLVVEVVLEEGEMVSSSVFYYSALVCDDIVYVVTVTTKLRCDIDKIILYVKKT